MLDNQLISAIIKQLNVGFTALSLSSIVVKQNFQPQQQGAVSVPTVYVHKISDERIGAVYRNNVWNTVSNTEVYTELQQYVTTFQISATATQDPSNANSLTASDIVNYAAYIMQNLTTLTAFENQNIGILKISDIRNPPFNDDRDRFEYAPNFDVTLTHQQTIVTTQPVITETVVQVEVV